MEKTKYKYTLRAAFMRTLGRHASTAFVLSLFWMFGASLWSTKIGTYAFAVVGILVYFFAIYNAGFDTASYDKKNYSPVTPKPWRGIYLPVVLTAVNIIAILIYKCAWHFGSDGEYLAQLWAVVLNVLSVVWFSPCKAVVGMDCGHFSLSGYLIVFLLPYAASLLGYFAGYKGFDIYAKLNASVYEKKK